MTRSRWLLLGIGILAIPVGLALGHWLSFGFYGVAFGGFVLAVMTAPAGWVQGASTHEGSGPVGW